MDLRACVPSPSTSKLLAVTALAVGLSSPAQAAWKRATQTKDGIAVDVRAEKGSSIVTVRGTWTVISLSSMTVLGTCQRMCVRARLCQERTHCLKS